jgi:hypothetical protein
MNSPAQRPALLGGSSRLQQENFLDDLIDHSLLTGEAALSVASGHSETSGQEQHDKFIPVWKQT